MIHLSSQRIAENTKAGGHKLKHVAIGVRVAVPVTGWKLDDEDRQALLDLVPPEYPDVIADHVTLDAHARRDAPLPETVSAEIVGGIDDEDGLQTMVVAIDGGIERPDGGTYHITWSLDRARGRKPVQSNEVIAEHGWRPLDNPIPIRLIPARF